MPYLKSACLLQKTLFLRDLEALFAYTQGCRAFEGALGSYFISGHCSFRVMSLQASKGRTSSS